MTERQLVDWIRRRGKGIGDDCAVASLAGARDELLITTDMFIEGVHFLREHPAAQCGHRVLARGLSDLAAMGATPKWFLLSLALPPWAGAGWVKRFCGGMLKLASRHRITLIGGDLSHSDRLTADIVAIGSCPHGTAIRRDGARPGDGIYVSGALGGRPALPEPRIALGRHLRGRATACMDLSDGLSADLPRLCRESGVAAAIDRPLPAAPGATLDDVLHAGEDYELLFTARNAPRCHRGVPLTRIGTILRGRPGKVTCFGRPLAPLGYDHFRNRS